MRGISSGFAARWRRIVAGALAVSLVPVTASAFLSGAQAAPGDLDPTFGSAGLVTANSPVGGGFSPRESRVLSDGRILVVGTTGSGASQNSVVARFNPDGSPDTTFAPGGAIASNFSDTGAAVRDEALSVDVTPTGDVIVGGNYSTASGAKAYVARYHSSGSGLAGWMGYGTATTYGGHARVLPVPGGTYRILLGSWEEGVNPMSVRKIAPDFLLDPSFGSGGVATVSFGPYRSVIQDLEISPDGNWVQVSGHVRSDGGLDNGQIARISASTGAMATGWAASGVSNPNVWVGSHDHATDMAFDAAGGTIVAFNRFAAGGNPAVVLRLNEFGGVDGTFSGGRWQRSLGSSNSRATGVAVNQTTGQIYVSITDEGSFSTDFALQRLNSDGFPDNSFGTFGGGLAAAGSCGGGGTTRPSVQPDGKIVVSGSCDGLLRLARFLAVTDTPPIDPVANLQLTVQPEFDAPARALDLDIHSLDSDDRAELLDTPEALAAIQAAPLRSSPLRSSPLRSSPLRSSPLRSSPLRSSPLRSSPLRSSELPPILLSTIPLQLPGGWSAILNDPAKVPAALLNLPPQSVTLQQLPDSALEGITLADIDLSATPLRSSSLGAVLLGNTPVGNLPAPAGGWCPLFAGQPVTCSSSPSATQRSLLALQLAGNDLSGVLASQIQLMGASLDPSSPLATTHLDNIELADTPIGALSFADAPSLFDCPTCDPWWTLADAQADDTAPDSEKVSSTAKVADLLALPLTGFSLSLGQLIVGMVPASDIPFEDIPLDVIMGLVDSDDAVYEAKFDLSCDASPGTTVAFDLPDGFTPVDGGAYYTDGYMYGGEGEFWFPYIQTLPNPTQNEAGDYVVELNPEGVCSGSGESTNATVGLRVNVSSKLALTRAAATVSPGIGDSLSVSGADLRLFDGAEGEEVDTSIQADHIYTGHISSERDVDLFTLPAPEPGSVVTAYLSHLPADYDLVLYGPDDPASAPLRSSPLRSSPLRSSPLRSSPVGDDGLETSAAGENVLAPETLQDVPLRSSPLRSSSLQRDLRTEVASTMVIEPDAGQSFTIQVSGFNGASSSDPYMLRVKVTPPLADLPCITRSYGTAGTPGLAPVSVPTDTSTLFLVHKERLGDVYGMHDNGTPAVAADDKDWGTVVWDKLQTLAAASGAGVKGAVIPVESDPEVAAAYSAWDADPCSIDRANNIVSEINAMVDGYRNTLPGLKNIVLVGSDEIVPMARLADLTTLSNQRDYRTEASFNGKDNPISRAFGRGFMLSDDPYGDFDPGEWLNGDMYVPDVALGRLVETPAQINAYIDRFITSNGRLDKSSSFTSGYDFLVDGANEVDQALRAIAPSGPQSLVNETWTRSDIVSAWNGVNGDGTTAPKPTISSVNAHYDHYRALPALGNGNPSLPADLLTASDLAASSLPSGALLFTMGCEGGLNMPDVFAAVGDERAADWAQTVADRKGSLLGNTGYGYGDTIDVAYSERLYANFAEGLDGTLTVGQALTMAKQSYVQGLAMAGPYDIKALEETVFYGLPMYRVGSTGVEAGALLPPVPSAPPASPTVSSTSFDETMNPTPKSTPRGTYWTVGDEKPQSTHYRPLTPRMDKELPADPSKRAHGVVIEEMTTYDVDNGGAGVDPVYSMPTIDLSANEPEPSIDAGIFPTNVTNLTRTGKPGGQVDTLVLTPGQFFINPDGSGKGVQRLYRRIAGAVLRSDSGDFVPPTIREVDATVIGSAGVFDVELTGQAANRVVVLYLDDAVPANPDGSVSWKRAELSNLGGGRWNGFVPLTAGATQVTQWLVQAVDGDGDVATSTNKGRYYEGLPLAPDQANGIDVNTTAAPRPDGFYDPGVGVSASSGPGVQLEVSNDGGTFRSYSSGEVILVENDGVHVLRFRGSDGSTATIFLPIREQSAEINVTVPADGQTFPVGAHVAPQFECVGSGITSCTASANPLDTSPGAHSVTFRALGSGGTILAEVTRTYRATYTFEGFFSPLSNMPTYNAMRAGSTGPVKFRLRSAGNQIVSSTSAVTKIQSTVIECKPSNPSEPVEGETALISTSELKFTDNQFHYNWKTAKTFVGTCRKLVFTFADGTTQQVWFQFK